MDGLFIGFAAAVFLTVVLMTMGAAMWWNATRGTKAKRIAHRLHALSSHGQLEQATVSPLRKRGLSEHPELDRLLSAMDLMRRLDTLLQQAGAKLSVMRFCALCAGSAGLGLLAMLLLAVPAALAPLGMVAGVVPVLLLIGKKQRRLQRIEEQLPDALDLMSRALRAGHAFPSALRMAGDEIADPLGQELKMVSDEVNYGIALSAALNNLSARVPGTDVGHFVVAVLIQRETGGNLTELLTSIALLIRERIKLFGQVRVLSAEGRFSAWILGALPFLVAGVLQVSNPEFMNVLWTDPAGRTLLYGTGGMMMLGVLWMRRLVRIRV